MDLGIRGKSALVTAASRGLGYAAACALAAEGVRVIISARNGTMLEEAATRIREQSGVQCEGITADLRDPTQIETLVARTHGRFGAIDILITNTGGPPSTLALEASVQQWQEAIDSMLMSVVHLSRLVIPDMRKRRWGRMIAITSISVKEPIQGLTLSNSVRAAVTGYLKTLSHEVARDNVTVNTVCPGYTRTNRLVELAETRVSRVGGAVEDVYAAWTNDVPAGRLGKPEELAALIAFLAGTPASFITGEAISVDGGKTKFLI